MPKSNMNDTSAYNFSLFAPKASAQAQPRPQRDPRQEPRKNNIIQIPKEHLIKTQKNRRRGKNRAAVRNVILMIIGASIALFMIFGWVRLAELTEQIEEATQQLTEAESLYTQYQMRSDSQLSLTSVEKYATEKLGMAKAEQTQMEYVELSSNDKGEVVQPDGGNWFTSTWNYIVNLLS